jgi:hypothetical protein
VVKYHDSCVTHDEYLIRERFAKRPILLRENMQHRVIAEAGGPWERLPSKPFNSWSIAVGTALAKDALSWRG